MDLDVRHSHSNCRCLGTFMLTANQSPRDLHQNRKPTAITACCSVAGASRKSVMCIYHPLALSLMGKLQPQWWRRGRSRQCGAGPSPDDCDGLRVCHRWTVCSQTATGFKRNQEHESTVRCKSSACPPSNHVAWARTPDHAQTWTQHPKPPASPRPDTNSTKLTLEWMPHLSAAPALTQALGISTQASHLWTAPLPHRSGAPERRIHRTLQTP
mmetsp:Transcript_26212/g.47247  ORF Transcript_26212/g.47247 Transcript_26212/m.47247 type:complete len:213 (-) Transcript_26212:17-655(-)